MKREEILNTLESLKKEAIERYKAQIKGIFGSYSRGEAQPASDIDILVNFQEGATLLDLAGLGSFLEQKLGCKVDIVSQRALREEIKPYVYSELIEL